MKTTEEKIREVQQKHREQMRLNRERVKERKARTHRLIKRGAIIEQAMAIPGVENMTDKEFQEELYRRLIPVHYTIPAPDFSCGETPCEDSR